MTERYETLGGAEENSAPASIETLYAQYADDVLRVCYFYLGDRYQAEEVCQDTFVRLLTQRYPADTGPRKSVVAEGRAQPMPRPVAKRMDQTRGAGKPPV